MEKYLNNIGKRCRKEKKPFKSGFLINTIKGVINHPQLQIPAYIFEEDESYVECRRCIIVIDGLEKFDLVYYKLTDTIENDDEKYSDLVSLLTEYEDVTDRGILRTILITLKPFKDNDEISPLFNKLADRLRSGSTNGVI